MKVKIKPGSRVFVLSIDEFGKKAVQDTTVSSCPGSHVIVGDWGTFDRGSMLKRGDWNNPIPNSRPSLVFIGDGEGGTTNDAMAKSVLSMHGEQVVPVEEAEVWRKVKLLRDASVQELFDMIVSGAVIFNTGE